MFFFLSYLPDLRNGIKEFTNENIVDYGLFPHPEKYTKDESIANCPLDRDLSVGSIIHIIARRKRT